MIVAATILALALPAQAKETPEAKMWLDRAVEAAGGKSVIYGCESLIIKGRSTRSVLDGRPLEVDSITYLRYPLAVRHEIVANGTRIAMVATPEEAFLASDDGPVLLNEIARRSLESPAMRNPISLLKARASLYFDASFVGMDKVDDSSVAMVKIKMTEHETIVAINAASGRIVQETYDSGDAKKGTIVVRLGDFQTLPSGMVYPHRMKVELDGKIESETTVKEVLVNAHIDGALFVSGLAKTGAAGGVRQ